MNADLKRWKSVCKGRRGALESVHLALKVILNGGYFDLATPFFEGIFEMRHLPIPSRLQKNIEFKFYESGHMVYAHEASLKELHDNVSAFILGSSRANPTK